ncbi:MAG: hypothetical protein ACK2U5_11430 [Candidatus Promineifilaceae bacterium]|jgi:hypothetical protein
MSTLKNNTGDKNQPGADHWGIRLLMLLARLSLFLPWIWLALFFIFVVAGTVQVGHWPTYGQPDPKDTGIFSILYYPVIVLLLLVMATIPIALGLAIIRLVRGVPQAIRSAEAAAYLAGLALLFVIVNRDLGGLMTWLGD